MPSLSRLARLALIFALAPLSAFAANPDDLLPVDQAYVLSATAPSRERIELHWKIADGYYLYRHRTDAVVEGGGFAAGKLQLPKGKPYRDEFFGDVETYRSELLAVLEGRADGADSVTLKVKYQGCADAGICYPPQTRAVRVALPAQASSGLPLAGAGKPSLFGNPGTTDALPLPAERAFAFEAIAGDGNTVLMRFTPARGYYLYRDRSSFKLDGATGIAAGKPQWPRGAIHRDEHFGEQVVYFDQVDVPLPVRRTRGEAANVNLTATFQGCQTDGICYPPMTRTVKLALPAGKADATTEEATVSAGSNPAPATTDATAQPASPANASPTAGIATPTAVDASADNAKRTLPPTPAQGGLLRALLFALLGGLLLNLMPCVLPVLSLKALGLAQSGENRTAARRHAMWYSLGVLVSFAAIGALVTALRARWGFQLQQPGFVAALVYLMFALGLSLSGVFTFNIGVGGIGNKLATKSGPAGDFFTGVLACVIASPCIGPYMGAALGYAFATPGMGGLLVFLMLGLGLALPMLLIGFVPALADRLPKPGAWMETLKQVLAFPLYLTAIWLLWVLGKQRGVDAMALVAAGLALFALALWWFERGRWKGSRAPRVLALLLGALALWPVWKVATLPMPEKAAVASEDHVAYSAEKLQALRTEGRVVFVDITADWCVTCKANEKAVLNREPFRQALREAGGVLMVGDWTNTDPAITAFLDRYKAVGVPLYVVFPRGGGEGEVLPTVLTDAIVRDALTRAAQ